MYDRYVFYAKINQSYAEFDDNLCYISRLFPTFNKIHDYFQVGNSFSKFPTSSQLSRLGGSPVNGTDSETKNIMEVEVNMRIWCQNIITIGAIIKKMRHI